MPWNCVLAAPYQEETDTAFGFKLKTVRTRQSFGSQKELFARTKDETVTKAGPSPWRTALPT